jgi:adenylate cyclase
MSPSDRVDNRVVVTRPSPKIRAATAFSFLIPNIRFGTEGYPENIARRLRATNILIWTLSASCAFFALWRLLDGQAHWKYTALVSLAYALLPLLHRFSPLAAPLTVVAIGYTFIFLIASLIGTDGGIEYFYFTAAALGILIVGTEQVTLTVLVGALAAGGIIGLHTFLPRDTGRIYLYGNFIANVIGSSVMLYSIVFYAVRQLTRAEERADYEHQRSETLLLNILPPQVAQRLKEHPEQTIADAYPEASILFADMAGFTELASDVTPKELVGFLNDVYTKLDRLVEQHDLEKIKSAGDAYIVVSGVPKPMLEHADALAELALAIRDSLVGLVDPKGRRVPVRIGIASGSVVAGVVGTRKLFYDVWGDTVNMASRMESTGVPGQIQVAPATYALLKDRFDFTARDPIEVRGKGYTQTWFLTGPKS